MKNYSDLENSDLENEKNGGAKCSLFNRLKDAIKDKDSGTAKGILTSGDKDLQEVLGTWIIKNNFDGTADSSTFLTYAIDFGEIEVAHAILDNADQGVLKELLKVESRMHYSDNTKESYTALSFAEEYAKKEDYAKLAKKIEKKWTN